MILLNDVVEVLHSGVELYCIDNAGVRALLVHTPHERAKLFYEHYGFQASPSHPLVLMLRLGSVKLNTPSPDKFRPAGFG